MKGILNGLGNILFGMLGDLFEDVTPVIRDEFKKLLLDLYDRAKATPNAIDDMVVAFIMRLFKFEVPEE